jgi:hypothetical protein
VILMCMRHLTTIRWKCQSRLFEYAVYDLIFNYSYYVNYTYYAN